jgi:SAM-dependent methyltransferase
MRKSSFFILSKRLYLLCLSKIFGFDLWHSKIFFENSAYAEDIVEICDDLDVNMVIELGCGLGELLVNVDKEMRIGIDIDKNVIKAANFKNSRNITFLQCNILDPDNYDRMLSEVPTQGKTEPAVFIMVNWIHTVELTVIKRMISVIQAKFNIKYIIIDMINPGNDSYKYKYTPGDFSDIGEIKLTKKTKSDIRNLLVLAPNNQ